MTKRCAVGIQFIAATMVLLAPFGVGRGEPAPATQEPGAAATAPAPIEFRTRPHVVLHAWARAALEGSTTAPAVEGSADLIQQLEAVQKALKDDRLWGLVDARIVGSGDARGVLAVMESMPETQKLSSGAEVSLREPGVAYARALIAAVDAWEKAGWYEVKGQIEASRDYAAGAIDGAKPDPIAFIKSSMGWDSWNGTVPVELVLRAPAPGGVTFRGVGGPVCMVGIGGFEGSMRMEVLLHEVMHAIDVSADAKDAPLAKLRDALIGAGVGPTDPAHRNAWHTVFFVQAGETVRRTIDPNHKDYGDVFAYYTRVGPVAYAVRDAWRAHLGGTKTVDEAITEIVAAAKATQTPPAKTE